DGRDADRVSEVAEQCVPTGVPALVRALELDVERPGERAREPRGRIRIAAREALARTAREADEAVRVGGDELERYCGCQRISVLAAGHARSGMRLGEDPAEVRVPARRLDEQGDVRAALERHLGAGDR